EDVEEVIERAGASAKVEYIRLGRSEPPAGYRVPAYAPWRQLSTGGGMTVIAVGPLASTYLEACEALPQPRRPNLWSLCELPIDETALPSALLEQLAGGRGLCVVEEHVRQGGAAAQIALYLVAQ